jgi:hypothetical protein
VRSIRSLVVFRTWAQVLVGAGLEGWWVGSGFWVRWGLWFFGGGAAGVVVAGSRDEADGEFGESGDIDGAKRWEASAWGGVEVLVVASKGLQVNGWVQRYF